MLTTVLRQRQFEQREHGLKVIGYLVRTLPHKEATSYHSVFQNHPDPTAPVPRSMV